MRWGFGGSLELGWFEAWQTLFLISSAGMVT